MEKEFCPYEQALALKELGFDESCFGVYYISDHYKEVVMTGRPYVYGKNSGIYKKYNVLTPTFSQAFRWFKENYNIQCYWYSNNGKHLKYWIVIQVNSTQPIEFSTKSSIPELECLKKLISIVKEK